MTLPKKTQPEANAFLQRCGKAGLIRLKSSGHFYPASNGTPLWQHLT